MTTILVTGATGFVGRHVVPALLTDGHTVLALARDRAGLAELSADQPAADRSRLDLRVGDVTRPETLPPALEGAEVVVHLVAIPRDRNGGRDLHRVNTDGTRAVVDAATAAGVRRFIHLGALGVEEGPDLHYADSKARAERIVAQSSLDATILRPSLLWGDGDGFFNIIASLARLSPGLMPVPGSGQARFQPLSVDDLGRIVALCVARPDTTGHTFELGGPAYWTYREITREVLAALGKQRLIVPVPVPLIWLVARAGEAVRLPFPVATDQLRQLRLDNTGELDAVSRAFGFTPRAMNGQLGYLRRRGSRAQQAWVREHAARAAGETGPAHGGDAPDHRAAGG